MGVEGLLAARTLARLPVAGRWFGLRFTLRFRGRNVLAPSGCRRPAHCIRPCGASDLSDALRSLDDFASHSDDEVATWIVREVNSHRSLRRRGRGEHAG